MPLNLVPPVDQTEDSRRRKYAAVILAQNGQVGHRHLERRSGGAVSLARGAVTDRAACVVLLLADVSRVSSNYDVR